MKHRLGAAVICAAILAPSALFAQIAQDDPSQPIKPGAVRVTTRSPDTDKWDNGTKSANGTQRTFKCKPLACPAAETVVFTFLKSPTRHPDPQALEKFANVDLPKSMRAMDAVREVMTDGAEKIETLSSKTATLKNYPAVLNETKFSRGSVSTYVELAIIFAGPMMIRVQSASPDQDLAQKSLNQFVEAMVIQEGPPVSTTPVPLPPASPPAAPTPPDTKGT
jgi:hypothetical protein